MWLMFLRGPAEIYDACDPDALRWQQRCNPVDPVLHGDKGNEISRAWVWPSLVTCPLQIVHAQLSAAAVQVTKSQQLGERGLLRRVTGFTELRARVRPREPLPEEMT